MRNRFFGKAGRLIALVMAFLLLIGCVSVSAENTVSETEALIDGILSYKMAEADAQDLQTWLDQGLADEAGRTAEWYVLALRLYRPELDKAAYVQALERYLDEQSVSGASTREKLALTLLACGRGEAAFVQTTCDEAIGAQGIMSLIYGQHLLNNGQKSALYTQQTLLEALLALQLEDGGWALRGETGDVDVTAMALQALAPCTEAEVSVSRGLEFLSARQNEDGGYSGFGEANAESTAQVIMALTALGVDPLKDARFIKNGLTALDAFQGYRLAEGGWAHTRGGAVNQSATSQALMALVSLWAFQTERGSFYDLSAVEAVQAKAAFVLSWRAWTCLALVAAAVLICVFMRLAGKRHIKNDFLVLCLAGALCLVVALVDIKAPSDYYGVAPDKGDVIGRVTMSIDCSILAGRVQSKDIPQDGVILPETTFELAEGETVYDILVEAARLHTIQMESEGTGGITYVAGIGYLYEFDYGDLSGWVYQVNGETPSVGCAAYALSDGDVIRWRYTCDLGYDLDD